jgi:hypothetical protein
MFAALYRLARESQKIGPHWGRTMSLNCGQNQAYHSFPRYMSMENHGGLILVGKPKNSEKSLLQCHFVHHKSYME